MHMKGLAQSGWAMDPGCLGGGVALPTLAPAGEKQVQQSHPVSDKPPSGCGLGGWAQQASQVTLKSK